MVRNYKRKTDRDVVVGDLKKAVYEVVKRKRSIRDAALMYNISKTTLHRHVKKTLSKISEPQSDSGNDTDFEEETPRTLSKYGSRQIFSTSEEILLEEYFSTSSAMHFGLTYVHARLLAFQYAFALNKSLPPKWTDEKLAGKEWMRCFMKRHPKLKYRKPENVSIARTSAFNPRNVKMFFENYAKVQENHKFSAERIVNIDETGITTMLIKQNRVKKEIMTSSSDSEVSFEINDPSSDSDISMSMTEDNQLELLLDDQKLYAGNFILVKFATKKKIYYYIGCVQNVTDPEEPIVKFMRRKPSGGFFYPIVDDIGAVLRQDIIAKLPKPKEFKGTKRTASYMNFEVSFLNYNVL